MSLEFADEEVINRVFFVTETEFRPLKVGFISWCERYSDFIAWLYALRYEEMEEREERSLTYECWDDSVDSGLEIMEALG